MKEFKNVARQGDMLIVRIEDLPNDIVESKPVNGEYIVTHSETGHNHVVKERPDVKMYESSNDNLVAYLVVEEFEALLEHHRAYKQHETIKVKPGKYRVHRQREEDVFGEIRRAID